MKTEEKNAAFEVIQAAAADLGVAPRDRESQAQLVGYLAGMVVRLREDKARLDWLDSEAVRIYPVAALTVKAGHDRHSSEWANCTGTARESIDRARAATTQAPEVP